MALHIQIATTRKTVVRAGDIIPKITARVKYVALHIQIGANRKTVSLSWSYNPRNDSPRKTSNFR